VLGEPQPDGTQDKQETLGQMVSEPTSADLEKKRVLNPFWSTLNMAAGT
jgi:hypothetical protein